MLTRFSTKEGLATLSMKLSFSFRVMKKNAKGRPKLTTSSSKKGKAAASAAGSTSILNDEHGDSDAPRFSSDIDDHNDEDVEEDAKLFKSKTTTSQRNFRTSTSLQNRARPQATSNPVDAITISDDEDVDASKGSNDEESHDENRNTGGWMDVTTTQPPRKRRKTEEVIELSSD